METKLRELQEKLAVEEADKIQLQNKLHQSLESEVKIYFFLKKRYISVKIFCCDDSINLIF